MWSYLKRLMTDETAFVGTIRAVLGSLGLAVESGHIPFPPQYQWVGIIGVGAALFMRSSAGSPQSGPALRGEK